MVHGYLLHDVDCDFFLWAEGQHTLRTFSVAQQYQYKYSHSLGLSDTNYKPVWPQISAWLN
jgi:hypothetical protein